ncbi:zinc finger matrin-type protein 4-like [Arapaima gigas]
MLVCVFSPRPCVSVGLRSSYSCSMCNVILNSIEQYHAHLRGSKHQNKTELDIREVTSYAEVCRFRVVDRQLYL